MSSNNCGALAAAVDALTELAVDELCVSELQELTAALAPQLGRLAGVQSALLGELDARSGGQVPAAPGPDGAPGPVISVRHWLRELTNMGGPAAGSALRTAIALRSLPLVSAAVRAGTLGPAQAAVLTRLVGPIDPAALSGAEPALVTVAAGRDPQSLADYVRHLLATWCEPQFENDQRTQDAKRYLQTRREDDGMLTGRFRLTSADSETILTLLEPLARSTGLTDGRDAGQRRADAMVEIFDLALRFADLPDAGGQRPQVSYVMPAGWAAGTAPSGTLADLVEASLPTDSVHPADPRPVRVEDRCALGAWSGPQTRSRIETILCDARLSRVLLDTVGQVRGLEALGDTVTKNQRRALAGRDHGCIARGCARPPAFCDAHHLLALKDGGTTDLNNLVLLCRRHHVLWHQGRLQLRDLHVPWLTYTHATHDPP